jgi:hypothetical protein
VSDHSTSKVRFVWAAAIGAIVCFLAGLACDASLGEALLYGALPGSIVGPLCGDWVLANWIGHGIDSL